MEMAMPNRTGKKKLDKILYTTRYDIFVHICSTFRYVFEQNCATDDSEDESANKKKMVWHDHDYTLDRIHMDTR